MSAAARGDRAMARVAGLFATERALKEGIAAVRAAGLSPCERRSPVPLEDDPDAAPSAVRGWVLGGAITGLIAGFALTIGTALYWPLRVGGKPIVALPAFAIIAFELTILFGALLGLAGFLRSAGLLGRLPLSEYRAETAVDHYSVTVACPSAQSAMVRESLVAAGAVAVILGEPEP